MYIHIDMDKSEDYSPLHEVEYLKKHYGDFFESIEVIPDGGIYKDEQTYAEDDLSPCIFRLIASEDKDKRTSIIRLDTRQFTVLDASCECGVCKFKEEILGKAFESVEQILGKMCPVSFTSRMELLVAKRLEEEAEIIDEDRK